MNGVRTDSGHVLWKRLAQVYGADELVEALILGWVGTVDGGSWRSQDHKVLCIRTSRQLCATGKNPPIALAALRAADHMRACVRVVLRARSSWILKLFGSVHRRSYRSGGYRYDALLHQKRVCTASSLPKTKLR